MTAATAVRPLPAPLAKTHVDVLIVGAGISGIGAAHYLRTKLPHKSFTILEARDAIGGTWDLFRYPGIRSNSDLHTFAYAFKPWTSDNAIADGQEILDYLEEAVTEDDLGPHIHFGHKVLSADFTGAEGRWAVTVERVETGERFQLTCGLLFNAAGYYDYAAGYTPEFEGRETFTGTIVHPQMWPEDLDYTGKRVVVIGSGATAVTLIPAMAHDAAHVTMLQRSPSYVMTLPGKDPIANGLRRVLPARFTEHGLRLESGQELPADIIVTATGLSLQAFGGVEMTVEGEPVDLADTLTFKSFMLSGIPNFAFAVGYTNSS